MRGRWSHIAFLLAIELAISPAEGGKGLHNITSGRPVVDSTLDAATCHTSLGILYQGGLNCCTALWGVRLV